MRRTEFDLGMRRIGVLARQALALRTVTMAQWLAADAAAITEPKRIGAAPRLALRVLALLRGLRDARGFISGGGRKTDQLRQRLIRVQQLL
jgi:hypothetical protein